MKAVIIIPARYGSSRLPAKVLLNKTGKYLVQHTYEQARESREADRVIIATDDQRVVRAVKFFDGEVMLTSPRHRSGTDRIAEVARRLKYPIIVNLQSDEPEIDPRSIDYVIRLARQAGVDIATLAAPFRNRKDLRDPNKVKVLIDNRGFAVNFSRDPSALGQVSRLKHHIGIYGYKYHRLLEFTRLAPTIREKEEKLEQLRAIENHFHIKVGLVKKAPVGIDTLKDYNKFCKRHH